MGGPDKVLTMEQIPLCPIKNSLFPLYVLCSHIHIIKLGYNMMMIFSAGCDRGRWVSPSVRAEWIQTNINKKWNGGLKELRRKVSELLFSLKAMGACFKSQPGFQWCWAMLKPFFLICPNLHSLSLCFTKSQHAIICEVFSTPFHFQKFNNTTFFINIIFFVQITLAVCHGTGTTTITIFQQNTDKTLSRLFPRKS